MMKIAEEVKTLIGNFKYVEAEELINKSLETIDCEKEKDYCNFLLAYVIDKQTKDRKSEVLKYASKNVFSLYPHPYAFVLLAKNQENNKLAVSTLIEGRKKFPNNTEILFSLLCKSTSKEQISLIDELMNLEIVEEKLIFKCIEISLKNDLNEQMLLFCNKILQLEGLSECEVACVKCLVGFGYINIGKEAEAEKYFEESIILDKNNYLNFIPNIGLFACRVISKDKNSIEIISNIDITEVKDFWELPIRANFDLTNKMLNIFNQAELFYEHNATALNKLKALKACYLFSKYDMFGDEKVRKSNISDLIRYNKNINDCKIYHIIFELQVLFKKYIDATKLTLQLIDTDFFDDVNIDFNKVLDNIDSNHFEDVFNIIYGYVNDKSSYYGNEFFKFIIDPIINYLWNLNPENTIKISTLCKKIELSALKTSPNKFAIAYSLNEQDNRQLAKKIYLAILEENENNTSAMNNLATIYEAEDDYENAEKLIEKGLKLEPSDSYLLRGKQRIAEKFKKFKNGLANIGGEAFWIKDRVFSLYQTSVDGKAIQISYKERPTVLKCNPQKANDVIKTFTEKNYIFKEDNKEDYQKNSYLINTLVYKYLNDEQSKIEKNSFFEEKVALFNFENFEKLDYFTLIDRSSKLQDDSYKKIFERDLYECASNFILKNYKSTIVLAGSIIENILIIKIKGKDINKYLLDNGKNRKIEDMDLYDLLYVVEKENLINKASIHLAQVLRLFRNIIHPANEARKDYDISDSNAELVWNALKVIIYEMLK